MAASSSSTKYKWDREKWEQDPTWWDPYNKSGRLKGKGRTTRARQERRALETPEERQARKGKRDQEALRLEKEASAKEAEIQLAKLEASVKEAEEKKKLEASAKEAAEAKVEASAKEAAEAKPAQAHSEKEKAAEAKAAPEKGAAAAAKKVFGPSEKEKAAEDKAASAKEASAEAKGSSEKDGPARKEQPSRPEATYKEVLVGWQLLEQQASAKEEPWVLVEKKKPCKKGTREPLEKKAEPRKQPAAKRKTEPGYVPLGSSSSSSSSSSPAPQASSAKEDRSHKEPLQKKAKTPVAIDWHGVFQITEWGQDKVPDSHIAALWDLQPPGFENHLVSFCKWKREQEVREWLRKLPVNFDAEHFCRERCGEGGKVEYALKKGIDIVIDDNSSILWEAYKKGLWVMPIATWHEDHSYFQKQGVAVYNDFVEAAQALIRMGP